MIKNVEKYQEVNDFTRDFSVITEKAYGLSTVIGFLKYHLCTSKIKLIHQKDFSSEAQYIYSIYSDQGVSIGRVVCFTNMNRFDVFYDIGSIFSSGLTVNPAV